MSANATKKYRTHSDGDRNKISYYSGHALNSNTNKTIRTEMNTKTCRMLNDIDWSVHWLNSTMARAKPNFIFDSEFRRNLWQLCSINGSLEEIGLNEMEIKYAQTQTLTMATKVDEKKKLDKMYLKAIKRSLD